MIIEIICGTYGYRDEAGTILPKSAKSAPFEVDDKEANRLIRLGVAAETVATSQQKPILEDDEDKNDRQDDSEKIVEKMNKPELVKMAKEMGLESSGGKEELIGRILSEKERLESEIPPALNAALPED